MPVSLILPSQTFPSQGRCIFCFRKPPIVNLTDEHIIPYGLSGSGEIKIKGGSCSHCNGYANEKYEQIALYNDFNVPRILLELKRRNRGKNTKPLILPRVALDGKPPESAEYIHNVSTQEYPNFFHMMSMEPPGKISGKAKGSDLENFQMGIVNLGLKRGEILSVATKVICNHTSFSMTIAKIGYTYAVAKLGLNGFNGREIRNLLKGKRNDVYNFVGGISKQQHFTIRNLHSLYIRDDANPVTVIVHLFASCGVRPYEVVVGNKCSV